MSKRDEILERELLEHEIEEYYDPQSVIVYHRKDRSRATNRKKDILHARKRRNTDRIIKTREKKEADTFDNLNQYSKNKPTSGTKKESVREERKIERMKYELETL